MKRLLWTLAASTLLHVILFQVSFSGDVSKPMVSVDRGKTSIAMKLREAPEPKPEKPQEPEEEPEPKKPEPKEPVEQDKPDRPEPKEVRKPEPKKKKKQPSSQKRTGARMVKKADYLRNPSPEYPSISRRRGEEGTVLLRVRVDREGNPLDVNVRESSGYERLDQSAVKTVLNWSFTPAEEDGEPVRSNVLVPVRFDIN